MSSLELRLSHLGRFAYLYMELSLYNFFFVAILRLNLYIVKLLYTSFELVYPMWHRTHFKMRYLLMAIIFVWLFGLGLNPSYTIPTQKVIFKYGQKYFLQMDRGL